MNTRASAAEALSRVIAQRQSLTSALEAILPSVQEGKERAFVQALCYGTLRWYFRLDFILKALLRKPLKQPQVHTLALLGLYQLALTRVKPHAAVAETVAAAKGKAAWAKPLLNALLRSYQRDQARLEDLADKQMVSACAHPAWLIDLIEQSWPEECAAILAQNNQPPPMALRVNRLKISRQAYLDRLRGTGIEATPSMVCDSAMMLDQPIAVESLPGFAQGCVSVQDAAAQLAPGLMDLRPGLRVLDACAAPGGKTLHILEDCPGLGELIAVDRAPERLEQIRQNLDREGLKATLLRGDAAEPQSWWNGALFERILLDAPCSATGVIRRHPDIKLLRQESDIAALKETQRRILEGIWPLLAPGGLLLYATCSILPQENEEQIKRFLSLYKEARALPIEAEWGKSTGAGRQILPGESGMDGFYYARLKKSALCPAR